jgi:hypothetical protein
MELKINGVTKSSIVLLLSSSLEFPVYVSRCVDADTSKKNPILLENEAGT